MCSAASIDQSNDRHFGQFVGRCTKILKGGKNDRRIWSPLLVLTAFILFSTGHFAGAYQKEQEQLKIKTVAADCFELRDSNNKLRSSLFRGRDNEACLAFFDKAGQSRLSMGIDSKGTPSVQFFDDKGSQKLSLALDSTDQTPQVIFYDNKQRPAIHLGLVGELGPAVTIGTANEGQVTLSVSQDGSSRIEFSDAMNKPRISLGVTANEPSISLFGDNQIARTTWRVLADGTAILSFADGRAQEKLVVKTDKEGKPSILLKGPANEVLREFR